ncbi:CaiB/BaiF CoA transferase family protein [Nakamurella endophytica]|uniref:CoA transferase n=1 Tax=Nakamurella endophytica TaxID=1748367 RepID=A0A917T8M3_9ACTN|nr:CaiB/BaiF CoA-transferase family protein [Nakamurella endophytica]GGM13929.1 CoA transferase [Nakamurella endophytica]
MQDDSGRAEADHGDAGRSDAAEPGGAPLHGLKVVEVATLFAGPLAATYLADFGADVVKVEHPQHPDGSRRHGVSKDGIGLWWKTIGRNKRTVTADLHTDGGRRVLLALLADADVLVENFRPGTLERWGLGPDVLWRHNPRLVVCRVTTFGQTGPYAHRPGFGSLAEAMSGFAGANGEPDGPPLLPPFALADGIAALAAAFATMVALTERDRTGRGDVVDLSILEPILMMMGPQITAWDQLGLIQPRSGNRSVNNAPRNVYESADHVFLAVSSSATSVAERVLTLVGREDLVHRSWFATGAGRAEHVDEIDAAVGDWIGRRTAAEVVSAFDAVSASVAPVYTVDGLVADPQVRHRGTVVDVPDPDFRHVAMQNVLFRLQHAAGSIRWTGRAHGADTDDVLADVGFTAEDIAALRAEGAV